MFLKQEKPEMDDYLRRSNFVSKGKMRFDILGKYFEKCPKFLADAIAKSSQNIFAYSFVS